MKKLQLFKTICTCATLFICTPSNAATVIVTSPNIGFTDLGSGYGVTNIVVDINDNNSSLITFDTLGSLQENFTISLNNLTGIAWDNVEFNFGGASILSPIGITPTTGTLVGFDITFDTALLYFAPPETVSLIGGSGILDTPDAQFLLGITPNATVVPIPAAVWLFGSGLLGLIGVARRKKA